MLGIRYLSRVRVQRQSAMKPLIAVIGATGTGKSELAVALASRFQGEIINCDALQFYESGPIVTNQIPIEERKGIPHHLLGCAKLEDEQWTPHSFSSLAFPIINDIHGKGKLPVVVGGSHHYMQQLLFENISVANENQGDQVHHPILDEHDDMIRAKLREVDPVMADRWHPNDMRRIRRSLEIWLQTGKPASQIYEEQEQQAESSKARITPRYPSLIFWVHANKEILNNRVDRRVDKMIESGLITELQGLYDRKLELESKDVKVDLARGVWSAIGVRSFFQYFDALRNGVTDSETLDRLKIEAVEQTRTQTRGYARRQMQWIGIKFFHAVQAAGQGDNLVVLDGTDLTKWSERVQDYAVFLTEKFLDGKPLPKSEYVSQEAENLLLPRKEYDLSRRRDLWSKKTCEICNVTAVTEELWLTHVKSSRHKRALKSKRKREEKAEYQERVRREGSNPEDNGQ